VADLPAIRARLARALAAPVSAQQYREDVGALLAEVERLHALAAVAAEYLAAETAQGEPHPDPVEHTRRFLVLMEREAQAHAALLAALAALATHPGGDRG
jgi:hypothetical protein